ncbi:EAL domain-containing protein [Alkalicoccus daliensis]|uniref:PAS domain S-box-containing protein/diguanylate cyclase (GGDEF) domain-containing protein n=1 Tax=Alkalicoccus daliensis TaxID=745820 RepID=A0A1H0HVN9_9BACI|nr:EAL domain-containing protein [Alkalicoccus daliensis]SDO23223.1 PAS domain S-box-containing protein/diguanylate cyclase (GGDEF) domain-containing protein [Alkalicoccus daliensis]
MKEYEDDHFIVKSRIQCVEAGMDPFEIRRPAERMSEKELISKRKDYDEILQVVSFFSRKVLESLAGTPILVVISDEKGYLLEMDGDETIRSTIQQLGIEPGVRFTQEDLGTNVISLALQESCPVALIGDDHFFHFLHDTACYSAPFHYSDVGNLLGSISIMTSVQLQNSLFLNMLANVVDSIERELLLRRQNRELDVLNQIMLRRTQNAIIVTNQEGTVTQYNDFAEILSGFTSEDIIGRDIFKSAITGDYFYQVLHEERSFTNVEMKFMNNNNEEKICLFDAQPIYDTKNSKMIGAFAQLRDITERYHLQKEYNYLAYHDELTKLPNRRYFQKELEQLFLEEKKSTALLLIDLDGFKNINDTFGHSNGDKLLQSVAERLQQSIQTKGLLARISGDEFMVLIPALEEEAELHLIAQQLLCQFQRPFLIENRTFYTTASIGAAIYHNTPPSLEEYMVHVDAAMYKAKSQGKNDYRMFSPEMYINSSEELLLENDLREAIKKEELLLHYQPQVDAFSGEIAGFEALIRWNHPVHGLLSPDKFIPLAEKTGLILPIGQWVIHTACRQHSSWMKAGLAPLKISVNLSAHQFLKQDFTKNVEEIMSTYSMNPAYLEFEITESMAMDFSYALKVLEELKSLGVQISMDDFGTGYSSLLYLKQLNIDTLKIDKYFVDDLLEGTYGSVLVSTIIAMADAMQLKVVAEGVETKAQLQELQSLGCQLIQGYYFSKAVPADYITENFNTLKTEFAAKR